MKPQHPTQTYAESTLYAPYDSKKAKLAWLP